MKKVTALILSLTMLSVLALAVSAASVSVDFQALPKEPAGGQGSGCYPEWTAGGYDAGQPIITFMNFGAFVELGQTDISQYSSVSVTYGQHSGEGKGFGDKTFIALADKPVQNADGSAADARIYARLTPVVTELDSVSWKDATQTATAAISAEGFTVGDEVVLAVFLDPARTNGMSIDSITFSTGDAGGTDNPNTGDGAVTAAAAALISLGCAVVFGTGVSVRRSRAAG